MLFGLYILHELKEDLPVTASVSLERTKISIGLGHKVMQHEVLDSDDVLYFIKFCFFANNKETDQLSALSFQKVLFSSDATDIQFSVTLSKNHRLPFLVWF